MKIEYSESGFHPENVNPKSQLELKELIHKNYGTTHCIFSRKVLEGVEYVVGLQKGELEEVELVDPEAASLLTHIQKPQQSLDKTLIFRKNQREDLTRVSIHNVPKKLYNTIVNFAVDYYGTKYGVISHLVNEAIKLMIKVENGFVELVETQNKSDKSFISDNRGQINLIDSNNILRAFKYLKSTVYELKNDIKEIKEYNIQSTFNIVPKSVDKARKVINGTVKSAKYKAKLDKADMVLDNVKRWNEHTFTVKFYVNSLVNLTGQGDPRTPRSDLKVLEAAGRIRKVRSSAHGITAYEFVENTEYYKYNSDLAKTRFFDDVKEKFFMDNEFTVEDLNEFIFEKYEFV